MEYTVFYKTTNMAEINIICPCQIYANCKNTVVCIYNGKITTGLITNQKKRRKLERMKSICIQCDRSIRYIDVLNFPLGHGNFSNFSMSMCNEFKWVEDNTRHRLIEIKRQIDRLEKSGKQEIMWTRGEQDAEIQDSGLEPMNSMVVRQICWNM